MTTRNEFNRLTSVAQNANNTAQHLRTRTEMIETELSEARSRITNLEMQNKQLAKAVNELSIKLNRFTGGDL